MSVLTTPSGPGPFPAVVMFHGCGGQRLFLDRYVEAFVGAGLAAVLVDSFTGRGWSRNRALITVCTGLELPGWQRAGDVLAVLWGLRGIAGVDTSRVALAGWSHGGWSIMDLMTMPLARPGEAGLVDAKADLLDGVRALMLVYPYCGPGALSQLRPWRHAPDVLAVIAEGDRVSHPALCRRALRTAAAAGSQVETWLAPGATHAFDEDGDDAGAFRFDTDLAAQAVRRMTEFAAGKLLAPRVQVEPPQGWVGEPAT